MTEADIYDTFCVAMSAFVAAQATPPPVSFPDVHFTPPDTGLWLEVKFFPNESDNYGIADDGGSVHKGFFQVGVCYRSGSGLVPSLTMVGAVIAAFDKGTLLGPARVNREPWAAAVLQMDDKNIVPVTIPYRGLV
jgi:hypothetical protein